MKRIISIFLIVVLLAVLLFTFRVPILQSLPRLLIHEDQLEKAEAIIVLSGGSFDRGNKAAMLYFQGYAPYLICIGGNPEYEFQILNMNLTEAESARLNLLRLNIPDSAITLINAGTSTEEEANLLAQYLINHQFRKVILLTSLYHTKRAKKTFMKVLKNSDVELMVCGAASSRFDEWHWWQSEDGLIAMNNELIKNMYYILKGKW